MMNKELQTKQRPKKTYTAPKLIRYGDVRSLTQGGATGGSETASRDRTRMARQSDRMTKQNIVRIGVHPLGIGIYLFDYKPEYRERHGRGRQFGVMADEVERVMPEAVSEHPDGYKMVNYGMLGVTHSVQSPS